MIDYRVFYLPSGPLNESNKAIQVGVGYYGDLTIRSRIWLPKSQIEIDCSKKSIKVPKWLLREKVPNGQTILTL